MSDRTQAQETRGDLRSSKTGKFRKTNSCEVCGKPSRVYPTVTGPNHTTSDLCQKHSIEALEKSQHEWHELWADAKKDAHDQACWTKELIEMLAPVMKAYSAGDMNAVELALDDLRGGDWRKFDPEDDGE